ncbi:MAG: sigma-70 family RNA polymerase sigma factor [Candidatus Acidiferrum sp.]
MATQWAPRKPISEEELVRAGQCGDVQALNSLFRRHHQSLFHSALNVMGNHEDAEDALQDGLLSAFRNLRRFEGRSQFSTWLTRIVINAALMRRRSMAARPATSPVEQHSRNEIPATEQLVSKTQTPEQRVGRLEILGLFKNHVEKLSPLLRTVFVLRIVRECTTNEAAKILSVPENTVKARLWRARRELAKSLDRSSFRGVHASPIHSPRGDPPAAD